MTPAQRLKMVKVLVEDGWGVAAVAQDASTPCGWRSPGLACRSRRLAAGR